MVVVRPDCAQSQIARGLLEQCESYLRGRGARVLHGGGVQPRSPFYLGLYGGSELPGVLESDGVALELYRSHGYRQVDRTQLFRHRLGDFRPPVDRDQIQFRRRLIVEDGEVLPLTDRGAHRWSGGEGKWAFLDPQSPIVNPTLSAAERVGDELWVG